MASISLKATPRAVAGNKVRTLRKRGLMPCVTYGHSVKTESLEISAKEFQKALSKAGTSTVLQLMIGDKPKNVVIHDVQYDPVSGLPIHADLYQVRMDEKIKAEVLLKFTGVSKAVKDLGGILVKSVDKLEVEALPADLPHELVVDLSKLNTFEDRIALTDIAIPKGVEVKVEDKLLTIASVTPPRSEEELKALDEAVTEDVESIEGVKPKDEGEDATEGEEKEEKGGNREAKKEAKKEPKEAKPAAEKPAKGAK
jgi:large subunit ribosomal protein L25